MSEASEATPKEGGSPDAGDGKPPDLGLPRELERALRPVRENVVAVDQPLALICQAQRSGGTLLIRLFDGHPQCHAHPHELLIGYPKAHTWPELPLDEKPEIWYAKLKEGYLSTLYKKGRRKVPLKAPGEKSKGSYPFLLPPEFQRLLFLDEIERRSPIASEREILDSYMTSLFNGWLDNHNLHGTPKDWTVAFSPRRAWDDGLDKHFELYPDGRLISILRDPLSWYSSAQGRDPEADPAGLITLWRRSAEQMLEAANRHAERVCIVRFDELLLDTPLTMRRLAEFLGIGFDPCLTVPTFNGWPVGANSSFGMSDTGVVADPVKRHEKVLSDEQRELVSGECEELYQEVLGAAERGAVSRGAVAVQGSS